MSNSRLPDPRNDSGASRTPARSRSSITPKGHVLDECALWEKLDPLLKFQIRESQAEELGRLYRQMLSEN